jgi:hypothetical protein
MAGVGLTPRTAKDVKDRLQKFYLTGSPPRFESQSALAEHLGIPRSTVAGWFQGKPKVPAPAHIITMAWKDGLSPTRLLLGQGPELIDAALPQSEMSELLRRSVVATVRSRTGAALGFLAEFIPPADQLWTEIVEARLARLEDYLRARHAVVGRTVVRRETPRRSLGDALYRAVRTARRELERWSPQKLAAFKRRARGLKFPESRRPGS